MIFSQLRNLSNYLTFILGDFTFFLGIASILRFPDKTATTITLARLLATSPSYDLRNGARALELAQLTYKATGSIEHAVVISMALAELGRCADALDWQKKLIDAAERQEHFSVAERLKKDLQLYEQPACRPPG